MTMALTLTSLHLSGTLAPPASAWRSRYMTYRWTLMGRGRAQGDLPPLLTFWECYVTHSQPRLCHLSSPCRVFFVTTTASLTSLAHLNSILAIHPRRTLAVHILDSQFVSTSAGISAWESQSLPLRRPTLFSIRINRHIAFYHRAQSHSSLESSQHVRRGLQLIEDLDLLLERISKSKLAETGRPHLVADAQHTMLAHRPFSSEGPSLPSSEPQAGPSRSPRLPQPQIDAQGHDPAALPSTSVDPASTSSSGAPLRPPTPHLDLATYDTPKLLRLLANLLQQIALANDQLRPDFDDFSNAEDEDTPSVGAAGDDSSSRSGSRASSHPRSHPHYQPRPSPTTALFPSDLTSDPLDPLSSTPVSGESRSNLEPINWGPLFTASKASLGYPSSLLSFHARHIPSITIEAYLLRILKYCPTTNEVFLGLLVYFDRMSRLGTPAGVGGESAGARRGIGRGFAIDSFNIHRLIIAGVTVASKFFSGELKALFEPSVPSIHLPPDSPFLGRGL